MLTIISISILGPFA